MTPEDDTAPETEASAEGAQEVEAGIPMAGEIGRPDGETHGPGQGSLAALTLGAIGVVYGDIGTSPIYA
ncbi:potassium transporter Kup, partial [Thioclava sp. BHET1]